MSTGRHPTTIDSEIWLLERLRAHGAYHGDPFDGLTEPAERREQFRKAILGARLQIVIADSTKAGKPETYQDVFARLYGEPLEPTAKKPTRGKPK